MDIKKYLIIIFIFFLVIGAVSANEEIGAIDDNKATDDILSISSDDIQNANVVDGNVGNVSDSILANSNDKEILTYADDSFTALQALVDASETQVSLDNGKYGLRLCYAASSA